MTRKERILSFWLISETVIVLTAAFVLWVRTKVSPPDPWKTMYTVDQWMKMFNEREHQPSALWRGISVGSIEDRRAAISGPGLGFRFTPRGLLEWQFDKLREQDPLMFLPLFDSKDSQLVLTGIHLYREFFPEKLTYNQSVEITAAFRKLLDQKDSRMRWTAIDTLGSHRWLTAEDIERGLNDEVLDVVWTTSFYLDALLRNRTLYDPDGKLIEGDPNGIEQTLETKRKLAPILLEHLNHTHFDIRSKCARGFRNLFVRHVRKEDGRIRQVPAPTRPSYLDWKRADWHTREQTKQQWKAWWAEHGEEALRFAHPPQD